MDALSWRPSPVRLRNLFLQMMYFCSMLSRDHHSPRPPSQRWQARTWCCHGCTPICKATRGDDYFRAYVQRDCKLSISHGCVIWKDRVVVSVAACAQARTLVHVAHCGVVAIKNIARRYLLWPQIDKQFEDTACSCQACQSAQRAPLRFTMPRATKGT